MYRKGSAQARKKRKIIFDFNKSSAKRTDKGCKVKNVNLSTSSKKSIFFLIHFVNIPLA